MVLALSRCLVCRGRGLFYHRKLRLVEHGEAIRLFFQAPLSQVQATLLPWVSKAQSNFQLTS